MSENLTSLLKSKTKTIKINRDFPTAIIGERINPTRRKAVLEALQVGNFDIVRKDALDQVAAGAAALDINAGVPGADEPVLIQQIIRAVLEVVDVPITNPLIPEVNMAVLAADLSMGRDDYGMRWIKAFRKREKEKTAA
jgi:cobalamin-dependent methionine synthase I